MAKAACYFTAGVWFYSALEKFGLTEPWWEPMVHGTAAGVWGLFATGCWILLGWSHK